MKLLHLIAAMVIAQTAAAQDFCKDIKKETGSNMRDWESPYKESDQPVVRVKRTISTDEDSPFDNFVMIFRAVCPVEDIYSHGADGTVAEKQEKKLTIVFDDNSKIVDDTVDVMHDISPDKTEGIRYLYYPVITETAGNFTSKKIAKFIISGQEVAILPESANAVMQYAKCIQSAK